jgi:CRISPR-associated protein (TIGR03986 family)
MKKITAPFNFVPVSDKVFSPSWANQISHDIPFEDGESGTIVLRITAESPVFVRNGHTEQDKKDNNDIYKSFSKINDRYFIPATSIKGAIRNVLEIMSFGKMRLDKNAMFAHREWDDDDLYPMKKEQNKLFCGYLRQEGDDYIVVDCGKPYRIGHKRIDEELGDSVFENNFSKAKGIDITKEYKIGENIFDPKTAIFKYELLKAYNNILSVRNFDIDDEFYNEYKDNRLKFSNTGEYSGRLVLTGQPDKWTWPRPTTLTKNAGKYYEFVFLEPKEDSTPIPFSKDDFNHFKFIYLKSPEWERAKKLLDDEGIPVFFRKTPQGNIRDIGLAFLYKLPYDHSPFDTLKDEHKDEIKADLADCIFGFINLKDSNESTKTRSLKGRVQFSPAFSTNAEPDNDETLTLSSPKASYYPLYIQQNGHNGIVDNYNTYNNGIISGWKRYMVRKNTWRINTEYNPNLDTIIYPVKRGAVFTGKIHFHNLRKVELGALLSALTFHNSEGYYHQLGQGKPYGFGKVRLEILDIKLSSNQEVKPVELMEKFEEQISGKIKNWSETEQIIELFTLAKKEVDIDDIFKYMHMDNDKDKNEFLLAKNKNFKQFVDNYSILTNAPAMPVSLIKIKYNNLVNESNSLRDKQQYEEAQKCLEEAEKLLPDRKEHKDILNEINKIIEEKRREEYEKYQREEAERIRAEKVGGGLSFLEEKYSDGANEGKYKVQDFKGAKNRIEQWMKKANIQSLPQEQWRLFRETLSRLYQQPDKKEQKLWVDFNSHIWRTIAQYVGEDIAKEWYDLLIKK